MNKIIQLPSTLFLILFFIVSNQQTVDCQTISNANWEIMNHEGIRAIRGTAKIMIYKNGAFYIGGDFHIAGNIKANNIVKWNGKNFSAMGTGVDSTVRAIAFDNSGNIYAGGDFLTADGITVNHIAKWDGTTWAPLVGGGVDSAVTAIAADDSGAIYVGGNFRKAGGISASHIAKWKDTTWTVLDRGYDSHVTAIVFTKGKIYVASSPSVCSWNGSKWVGICSVDGDIRALAADSKGNLFVGGGFGEAQQPDGKWISQTYLAKWVGTSWDSTFDAGLWYPGSSCGVNSIAIDNKDKVYAQGSFQSYSTMKWYGLYGAETPYAFLCSTIACDSNGKLFAIGNDILKWEYDTVWTRQTTLGMDGDINALCCDKQGTLYAGGLFTTACSLTVNRIVKWKNGNWSNLGTGITQLTQTYCDGVEAVTCDDTGKLYVGGTFNKAGDTPVHYLAQWNGFKWDSLSPQIDYEKGDYSHQTVKTLLWTNGRLYAGGNFMKAAGNGVNNAAIWNDNKVGPFGSGMSADGSTGTYYLKSIIINNKGGIYAGGDGKFSITPSIATYSIAKWNGTSFDSLGGGLDGRYSQTVFALASDNSGNIFAGGIFISSGSIKLNSIAKWNGSAWDSLGSGVNGYVYALAVDKNGILYAGGGFSMAGGIPAKNIAKWDGVSWSPLGTGTDNPVKALAVYDSVLYVGGSFYVAGGKVSPYIAKVNIHHTIGVLKKGGISIHSEQIRFRLQNATIYISNVAPFDNISIYTLSGKLICSEIGKSELKIKQLSTQPLLIRVNRNAITLAAKIVL